MEGKSNQIVRNLSGIKIRTSQSVVGTFQNVYLAGTFEEFHAIYLNYLFWQVHFIKNIVLAGTNSDFVGL